MSEKDRMGAAAVECGASAVLELPVCYATGSAEYFAAGAVALLDSLHCIDAVCFGSECGDLRTLSPIARILADEPDGYKSRMSQLFCLEQIAELCEGKEAVQISHNPVGDAFCDVHIPSQRGGRLPPQQHPWDRVPQSPLSFWK